ncbi:unnamed protein product [Menidia menidia]|uniref:(Atlantic silverside) hypothetical protein n=1 Tax=Menidia menidia TaxID=238744 RepID=A0A8S4C0L1_9TELE|nr:unnamed protein product [Menidia menidia]
MSQRVLLIGFFLLSYSTQSQQEFTAECGQSISLKCPPVNGEHVDFLSLAWYKIDNDRNHGIIRKRADKTSPDMYDFPRPASFGENHSLFLPHIKPGDAGTYECTINANVGGQNKKGRVLLIVHECVNRTEPTVAADTLTTRSNQLQPGQVEDLPVMRTVMGYVVVAVAKIILSLISIRVIHIMF